MKPDPERLPVNADGVALAPRPLPGYYPKFSTLSQQAFWDAATRAVVLKRVTTVPPVRFFTASEAAILQRVIEHVLPQDDRVPERRIPILPFIDERLLSGRTAGYRFEDMPPDGEAHRRGLQAIDAMALAAHGAPFLQLGWREADVLLKSIHDAEPLGAGGHLENTAHQALLDPAGAGLRGSLLRASVGLGRDRLRRPGVPARVLPPRKRRAGTVGNGRTPIRMGRPTRVCV